MIIDDIYKLGNQAVRFYPNQIMKCLQPQTFAVLDNISQVNLPNLGKILADKNKPYFFSRLWESLKYNPSQLKFDYPAVFMYELNFDATELFKKSSEQCHTIQVMVVDAFKDNACQECKNPSPCDTRVAGEIYRDTEAILSSFLSYFKSLVVLTDGQVFNSDHYNYLIDEGETIIPIDLAMTNKLNNAIRASNSNVGGFRWEGKGTSTLYGTVMNIKFCFQNCVQTDFEFTKTKTTSTGDAGCC